MTSTHSRPTIDEPRVWIGCLECYNAGRLVGDWYAATEAAEVTTSQLHGRPIPTNSHEELWCLDTDNIPVDGEMSPMDAALWGEVYDELDSADMWPALCAWVRSGSYTAQGDSDLPVVSDFVDAYRGQWDSLRDYATELADEVLAEADETLARYFDYSSWARDLEGDYTVERARGGGVYVFTAL